MYFLSWQFGELDYVVMFDSIDVLVEGEDFFFKQIIDIEFEEDCWIRVIEFLLEDLCVMYYFQVIYSVVESLVGNLFGGSGGVFVIWMVGMLFYVFLDGMGCMFGKKVKVVVDQYYYLIGEVMSDVLKIGIYFGEGEFKKEVVMILVMNIGLCILLGVLVYVENVYFFFDKDVQIFVFLLYMYVCGKVMSYELIYLNGDKEMLFDVLKYDYNWQWFYYLMVLIDILVGSCFDVIVVWDNFFENFVNFDLL